MPRLRLRVLAALFISIAGVPLSLRAQGGESRSVTVKRGDTLWDLAKQYLGDSFLWPEIYRLNTGLIEDPHWIYPGQLLKLPGGATAAGQQPAGEVAVAPRQSVSRQGLRMTVFNPAFNKGTKKSRESLILGARQTAVRPGEYVASPFMWATGGPSDGGYIETTAALSGIDQTLANRPLQSREQLFIVLPRGAQGVVGERLLTYRLGELVEGQGQVVIPTGIIRLVGPRLDGRARAELVEKFEDVFSGQGATWLDTLVIPPGRFPQRIEFGLAMNVVWLNHQPVLPTAGQYLILSAGGKEGLMPGDQVSLRRDRPGDGYRVPLPDEEVAVAQVTRVTPWGASAIVIEHEQAGITEGMRARVTAKMP